MKASWLVALAALAIGSPALAQDKATIQKLNETFQQALNKGDTASVAQMYAEDAYLLPPGADIVRGRENIQKFWQAVSERASDLSLSAVDVKPLGDDAAREIGTFTFKTKGQQPQSVAGKYVVIWQKVGGDWKLAADIWNRNN